VLVLQMRRLKESLVSVALRLQVSIRVAQDDEHTIASLRKDALEAKKQSLNAQKQAEVAAEIIQTLKIEISSLRRQLRDLHLTRHSPDRGADMPPLSAGADVTQSNSFLEADADVERMMAKKPTYQLPPDLGGQPDKATPFQQWKMQEFLWTPDTASASIHHDKHTVDMMSDMATFEALGEFSHIQKPTRSMLGKSKRIPRRSGDGGNVVTLPSMGVSLRSSTSMVDVSRAYQAKVNPSTGMWGKKETFRENRARVNFWGGNSNSILEEGHTSPPKEPAAGGKQKGAVYV
jgi:hypothetical protein